VYLLKHKSETLARFKEWKTMVEKQFGESVKRLRSDNGGEYISSEWEVLLKGEGIVHELTVPNTPEQNGVAERFNRTLVEMGRCMIHGASLKKHFWGEAIMCANYVRNRCPSEVLKEEGVTPFEALHRKKPHIEHFRIFGCRVAVHIPTTERKKLDRKVWDGVFMGYSEHQKAYRVWDIHAQAIKIRRDVIFYEHPLVESNKDVRIPPSMEDNNGDREEKEKSPSMDEEKTEEEVHSGETVQHTNTLSITELIEPNSSIVLERIGRKAMLKDARERRLKKQLLLESPRLPEIPEEHEEPETLEEVDIPNDGEGVYEDEEGGDWHMSEEDRIDYESHHMVEEVVEKEVPTEGALRRSQRERQQPLSLHYSKKGDPEIRRMEALMATSIRDKTTNPETLEEALSRGDGKLWQAAMEEEMKSLEEAVTWELVPRPSHQKAIKSKWIFVVKYHPDGTTRHKARFVARGFSQKEGIDYHETFSPVMKYQSLRILLSIANARNMFIEQMDVKTAFLHGDLEEEIYLEQPVGFIKPGEEAMVCRLKKSLYGLKQSPRCWNVKMDGTLKEGGFRRCICDTMVYVKGARANQVYLGLYVDDMVIISESMEEVAKVKTF